MKKPKEKQPSAGESGRRAPSPARAAGDHSRAPRARKAAVPCSRRRCGRGERRRVRAQNCWSESSENNWKPKGKQRAPLVCRRHYGACLRRGTVRHAGGASQCEEHRRAHRNRTRERTAPTARECTISCRKPLHFTVTTVIFYILYSIIYILEGPTVACRR